MGTPKLSHHSQAVNLIVEIQHSEAGGVCRAQDRLGTSRNDDAILAIIETCGPRS